MNEQQRASDYQRGKKIFFLCNLLFDIVLLNILFLSGVSSAIKSFAMEQSDVPFFVNGLYLAVFFAIFWVVHWPMRFYEGYVWERRFGLSHQRLGGWLIDEVKHAVLGFVIAFILVEVVYALIGYFPDDWWVLAGIFWLLLTFFLARVTPTMIVPLFFKYKTIEDEALKKGLRRLFEKCQVPLKDIYAVDFSSKTKKANAFFCGVGENRRVVLSDTLISGFTPEEIEVVVAHEIGHYRHRDIMRFLIVQTTMAFTGFYLIHIFLQDAARRFGLSGIGDVAFFPMVLLGFLYFGLAVTPLVNFYSRRREKAADSFALEETRRKESFISVMRKLGEINLAEMQPDKLTEVFLYDHPPLAQRISFAERFEFKS